MKSFFLILLVSFTFIATVESQVKTNRELIMTSLDSSNRVIYGVGQVENLSDLVPVISQLRNNLLFKETSNDDTLNFALSLNYPLSDGLGIWFSNSFNSENNPLISIDQINYFPLVSADGTSDTNCIKQNEIQLVVFNGASFQEIFPNHKICPQGYVNVNTEYCIQSSENIPTNYWNAVIRCEKDGAKLCSWGEWYFACQNSGLGLSDMTNNWEWTESGSNHATSVLILGNGNCKSAGENNTQVVTFEPYRCCYRKK